MCHCVTEQKQKCLMTQFVGGLVLIAHNEYVFTICTVLHGYWYSHLEALIFRACWFVFFGVSCFRATKLCWADGLPVDRELTEVIKHFSYSTQQVTFGSLTQLSAHKW